MNISTNELFAPEVFSSRAEFAGDELVIGGCSVSKLAKEFGTPVFVLDESDFRDRATGWKSALEKNFDNHAGSVFYAAKSFISVEVAKWVDQSGIGLDVCTDGELAVALAANFPAERIEVHGNNKSISEITRAIEVGVRAIVIDSFVEIERVAQIARQFNVTQKVLLRLTPGIEAHTHEFIATAHEDVKFGFSISSGAAWRAIEAVMSHSSLRLAGIHAHIGSQIFGVEGFTLAAARLIELLAKYRDHFDAQLPELDLGGGFGIAYLPGEESVDPMQVLSQLSAAISVECAKYDLHVPLISIEPGRAIVGPTTTTIYSVGTTKSVELDAGQTRRYVSIDGGMSDNIRTALYDAQYYALLANRRSEADLVSTRIVGKHCESGDIIIRSIELAVDVEPGDLLAIPATGAYGRSMASNYNHVPRPAVVAVKDGKARLIVRRETESDLLRLDVVEPERSI
ncbi:MAG: diaminopimelate decarboxylase [Actinomycetes bacterium]